MNPQPSDVADFLGNPSAVDLALRHLPTVTAMVKAYTRGNGFYENGDVVDDVAAVIISATARSLTNPAHNTNQTAGPFSVRPGVFNGWTLPELAILHNYRRRTA